jgi:hypothetical protein
MCVHSESFIGFTVHHSSSVTFFFWLKGSRKLGYPGKYIVSMPRCKITQRVALNKTRTGHHNVPFTPGEIARFMGFPLEQDESVSFVVDDEDVCQICFDTGGTLVLCDFCDGLVFPLSSSS